MGFDTIEINLVCPNFFPFEKVWLKNTLPAYSLKNVKTSVVFFFLKFSPNRIIYILVPDSKVTNIEDKTSVLVLYHPGSFHYSK